MPHEVDLWGIYLPPFLVASLGALFTTWAVVRLLNRFRLSRYFWQPPVVFVALIAIFTVGFLTVVVPG